MMDSATPSISNHALFAATNLDSYYFAGPITVTAGSIRPVTLEIEVGTVAGSSDKPNEDAFAVRRFGSAVALAIFDGATSLKKIPAHDAIGMSGARYASHFLRDQFLALPAFSNSTLSELNQRLGQAVVKFEGLNLQDVVTLPTSTATIVLIDPDRDMLSIQHVSDSFALARFVGGAYSLLTTDRLAELSESLIENIRSLALNRGISNREARTDPGVQQKLIDRLQQDFNRADGNGVGVVNGSPEMDRYIDYLNFPLSSFELLLLGSDGLPAPQHPLSNSDECRNLIDMAESKGLQQTIEFKKQEEDSDPDWTTARWKHSDDGTGILVRFRRP